MLVSLLLVRPLFEMHSMDAKIIIEQFQDHLAPKLDTYEQAIYLYVLRHSRLQGIDEVVIGFKSARRRIACGIGEKGKPMAEGTCYEKLRSLQSKRCIQVLSTERDGTKLHLNLPSEIPGLIPSVADQVVPTLEELDFFASSENRLAILRREANRCFYCLRSIDQSNYVIEHVSSRPDGDSGFRNVVAACRSCNNRKGAIQAEDFLRGLYREGFLTPEDLQARLDALGQLRNGELRPAFGESLLGGSGFAV